MSLMPEEHYEVMLMLSVASRPSQRTLKTLVVTCKTKMEGLVLARMPARRAVARVKVPVETQRIAKTAGSPARGQLQSTGAHLAGIGRVTTGGTSLASPWPPL